MAASRAKDQRRNKRKSETVPAPSIELPPKAVSVLQEGVAKAKELAEDVAERVVAAMGVDPAAPEADVTVVDVVHLVDNAPSVVVDTSYLAEQDKDNTPLAKEKRAWLERQLRGDN